MIRNTMEWKFILTKLCSIAVECDTLCWTFPEWPQSTHSAGYDSSLTHSLTHSLSPGPPEGVWFPSGWKLTPRPTHQWDGWFPHDTTYYRGGVQAVRESSRRHEITPLRGGRRERESLKLHNEDVFHSLQWWVWQAYMHFQSWHS